MKRILREMPKYFYCRKCITCLGETNQEGTSNRCVKCENRLSIGEIRLENIFREFSSVLHKSAIASKLVYCFSVSDVELDRSVSDHNMDPIMYLQLLMGIIKAQMKTNPELAIVMKKDLKWWVKNLP